MSKLNGLMKLIVVLGGYVVACLVASVLVYINQLFIQDPSQASAGMSAFGDAILFIGTFGVLALIPTGLGFYFLFRKLRTRS